MFFVKYANNYCIIGDVICKNMHHLTADDKALILALRVQKRWNIDELILEFPNKQWKRQTLYYLVRKIYQTGSAARLSGSGRRRTARTAANIEIVDNMICSQDDNPGTSKSPREIARETGMSRSSVRRVAKRT